MSARPRPSISLRRKSVLAIDFDGTCLTHHCPGLGKEIGAPEVLKDLVAVGHRLILYTMRASIMPGRPNNALREAVEWFDSHKIPLWAINSNPGQHHWTMSPKIHADLYIDDAALGIPLLTMPAISDRPFVCWPDVRTLLERGGWLPPAVMPTIKVLHRSADGKVITKYNRKPQR